MQDLTEIKEFLGSETPDLWVQNAIANQAEMLIDHAHCEKKSRHDSLEPDQSLSS
jgi:tRNA-(ms[2]io[6]A)-hydroxylase